MNKQQFIGSVLLSTTVLTMAAGCSNASQQQETSVHDRHAAVTTPSQNLENQQSKNDTKLAKLRKQVQVLQGNTVSADTLDKGVEPVSESKRQDLQTSVNLDNIRPAVYQEYQEPQQVVSAYVEPTSVEEPIVHDVVQEQESVPVVQNDNVVVEDVQEESVVTDDVVSEETAEDNQDIEPVQDDVQEIGESTEEESDDVKQLDVSAVESEDVTDDVTEDNQDIEPVQDDVQETGESTEEKSDDVKQLDVSAVESEDVTEDNQNEIIDENVFVDDATVESTNDTVELQEQSQDIISESVAEDVIEPTSTEPQESTPEVVQTVAQPSQNYSVNTYPAGQCTWGVKSLASWVGNNWGNGADWAQSASNAGYYVSSTPAVGTVASWDDGGYGHVAYVTNVDEQTGMIQALEANYAGNQAINNYRGWFDPTTCQGQVSYIYNQSVA